jgi:catalase
MPLPDDQKVIKTSDDILSTLHSLAGPQPGFRSAHAKGVLLTGIFTPSSAASSLSSAKHFNQPSTPVTVRFSSSTGLPEIPDTVADSNPRGIAVRFHLGNDSQGKRVHTDIIAHSTPFFPVSTGEDFLAFFQAIAKSATETEHPNSVEKFLGSHPKALAFVQAPKPAPASFATTAYFGVNAFRFVSGDGTKTYVRYQVVPVLGVKSLNEEELKDKSADYLYDGIKQEVKHGPAVFKLLAQIALDGDVTDDATVQWPEDREVVELGEVKLDTVVQEEENAKEQKYIIFDPVPRVQGVEPSEDPLLTVRAAVYLISGRERRSA